MFAVRELYCVVCGATFLEPDILNPDTLESDPQPFFPGISYNGRRLQPSEAQWLYSFRLFGTSPLPGTSAINEALEADVFISSLAQWRYGFDLIPKVSGENGLEEQFVCSFFSKDGDSALFPVHDGCLDLLRRFISTRAVAGVDQSLSLSDFARAFVARLRYCNRQPREPSGWYFSSGGLEWDHGYFGARPYWADPWNAEPGREWLVADPLPGRTLGVDKFLSECLDQGTPKDVITGSLEEDKWSHHASSSQRRRLGLMALPPEILTLIVPYLPLRSLLSLHATSREMHSRLPALDAVFWRHHCLRVHGGWFVELDQIPSRPNANWKVLAQVLTLGRRKLIASAPRPDDLQRELEQWMEQVQKADELVALAYPEYMNLPQVPSGLLNRLRIWTILETLDVHDLSEFFRELQLC